MKKPLLAGLGIYIWYTLKDCDQIYILKQGKIVGNGTYIELIRQNKQFMEMAKVPKK